MPPKLTVLKTGSPTHETCEALTEDILALIYEREGVLSVAAALGVLEIVKAQLIADHMG